MKKLICAALSGLSIMAAPLSAHADLIGVYAGANYWNAAADGSIASADKTAAEFDFDTEGQNMFYVAIEHPVPLVPNFKIRHTNMVSDGSANVTGFEFNNVTFNGDVDTKLDLTHTDFVLYYELLDNVVSLDLGLNVKYLDGFAEVSSSSETTRVDLTAPIPMAYASVEGMLPFTGFSAKAEANLLSIDDSEISDFQAEIKYDVIDNIALDLGVTVGYRRLSIKLDDIDDIDSDLTFSGPYVGLEAHF
ncbi:TIGR04219 family outer membrane beta-barrel protein [Marinobacterium jannaschii]|uniref:TIGR04219 family outer membrane beta-barrel protein n=1 Tax=Marinobacterium jannaschii TaxID=64970 RepID=UPI00048A3AAE|nr:TIGR04219 family outer membrane beta-barrel protein [Marinobacterium jannaschii]